MKQIYKIKEIPTEERPRERLIKDGPDALTDPELLAVILNTGLRTKSYCEDVLELSNRILKEYGPKAIIVEKNVEKLIRELEIPKVKACQIVACFELGRRFFKKDGEEIYMHDSEDTYNYLKDKMEKLKKEQFRGLHLNSRNKLIHDEIISLGTLTTNLVHPREVFQPAIEYSAAAIILAHNHPSGDPQPSDDDIQVTEQIIKASKIINIEVLDHIIIGGNRYLSLKDKKLI
ncbi:MAG: JAB domain-containing protein [Candidatus Omnitrophica bacterium]|nr:JAB domain-containing protein [Candidatus Omnitrophota bacterium]